MINKELLFQKLEELPDFMVQEVEDFIEFLQSKWLEDKKDVLKASESSLSADWLKAEEDEAWANVN